MELDAAGLEISDLPDDLGSAYSSNSSGAESDGDYRRRAPAEHKSDESNDFPDELTGRSPVRATGVLPHKGSVTMLAKKVTAADFEGLYLHAEVMKAAVTLFDEPESPAPVTDLTEGFTDASSPTGQSQAKRNTSVELVYTIRISLHRTDYIDSMLPSAVARRTSCSSSASSQSGTPPYTKTPTRQPGVVRVGSASSALSGGSNRLRQVQSGVSEMSFTPGTLTKACAVWTILRTAKDIEIMMNELRTSEGKKFAYVMDEVMEPDNFAAAQLETMGAATIASEAARAEFSRTANQFATSAAQSCARFLNEVLETVSPFLCPPVARFMSVGVPTLAALAEAVHKSSQPLASLANSTDSPTATAGVHDMEVRVQPIQTAVPEVVDGESRMKTVYGAQITYRLQYRASKLSPAHRVGSEVVLPLSVLEALLLTSLHNHTSLVQPSTGPGDMASAQDGHLMHSVQRTLDFNEDKFPGPKLTVITDDTHEDDEPSASPDRTEARADAAAVKANPIDVALTTTIDSLRTLRLAVASRNQEPGDDKLDVGSAARDFAAALHSCIKHLSHDFLLRLQREHIQLSRTRSAPIMQHRTLPSPRHTPARGAAPGSAVRPPRPATQSVGMSPALRKVQSFDGIMRTSALQTSLYIGERISEAPSDAHSDVFIGFDRQAALEASGAEQRRYIAYHSSAFLELYPVLSALLCPMVLHGDWSEDNGPLTQVSMLVRTATALYGQAMALAVHDQSYALGSAVSDLTLGPRGSLFAQPAMKFAALSQIGWKLQDVAASPEPAHPIPTFVASQAGTSPSKKEAATPTNVIPPTIEHDALDAAYHGGLLISSKQLDVLHDPLSNRPRSLSFSWADSAAVTDFDRDIGCDRFVDYEDSDADSPAHRAAVVRVVPSTSSAVSVPAAGSAASGSATSIYESYESYESGSGESDGDADEMPRDSATAKPKPKKIIKKKRRVRKVKRKSVSKAGIAGAGARRRSDAGSSCSTATGKSGVRVRRVKKKAIKKLKKRGTAKSAGSSATFVSAAADSELGAEATAEGARPSHEASSSFLHMIGVVKISDAELAAAALPVAQVRPHRTAHSRPRRSSLGNALRRDLDSDSRRHLPTALQELLVKNAAARAGTPDSPVLAQQHDHIRDNLRKAASVHASMHRSALHPVRRVETPATTTLAQVLGSSGIAWHLKRAVLQRHLKRSVSKSRARMVQQQLKAQGKTGKVAKHVQRTGPAALKKVELPPDEEPEETVEAATGLESPNKPTVQTKPAADGSKQQAAILTLVPLTLSPVNEVAEPTPTRSPAQSVGSKMDASVLPSPTQTIVNLQDYTDSPQLTIPMQDSPLPASTNAVPSPSEGSPWQASPAPVRSRQSQGSTAKNASGSPGPVKSFQSQGSGAKTASRSPLSVRSGSTQSTAAPRAKRATITASASPAAANVQARKRTVSGSKPGVKRQAASRRPLSKAPRAASASPVQRLAERNRSNSPSPRGKSPRKGMQAASKTQSPSTSAQRGTLLRVNERRAVGSSSPGPRLISSPKSQVRRLRGRKSSSTASVRSQRSAATVAHGAQRMRGSRSPDGRARRAPGSVTGSLVGGRSHSPAVRRVGSVQSTRNRSRSPLGRGLNRSHTVHLAAAMKRSSDNGSIHSSRSGATIDSHFKSKGLRPLSSSNHSLLRGSPRVNSPQLSLDTRASRGSPKSDGTFSPASPMKQDGSQRPGQAKCFAPNGSPSVDTKDTRDTELDSRTGSRFTAPQHVPDHTRTISMVSMESGSNGLPEPIESDLLGDHVLDHFPAACSMHRIRVGGQPRSKGARTRGTDAWLWLMAGRATMLRHYDAPPDDAAPAPTTAPADTTVKAAPAGEDGGGGGCGCFPWSRSKPKRQPVEAPASGAQSTSSEAVKALITDGEMVLVVSRFPPSVPAAAETAARATSDADGTPRSPRPVMSIDAQPVGEGASTSALVPFLHQMEKVKANAAALDLVNRVDLTRLLEIHFIATVRTPKGQPKQGQIGRPNASPHASAPVSQVLRPEDLESLSPSTSAGGSADGSGRTPEAVAELIVTAAIGTKRITLWFPSDETRLQFTKDLVKLVQLVVRKSILVHITA